MTLATLLRLHSQLGQTLRPDFETNPGTIYILDRMFRHPGLTSPNAQATHGQPAAVEIKTMKSMVTEEMTQEDGVNLHHFQHKKTSPQVSSVTERRLCLKDGICS